MVIDHLGLPGVSAEADRAVLTLARHEHVWVKASAPYRSADAERMLNRILGDIGRDRLLWGSDWPWTRHEQGRTYAGCLDWLRDQVDKETFDAVTAHNPAKLLNWSPAPFR